ncbi:MAG: aldehyde dehydrogenase family protein, partial [Candidatus Tectimicrobiota bacterium]
NGAVARAVRGCGLRDGGQEEEAPMVEEYRSLIGGEWRPTKESYEIKSPYSQEVVAVVARPDLDDAVDAVEGAHRAYETTRALPSWKRAEILRAIAEGIKARHEEFARTIALEAGKPIKQARSEVSRAVNTFWVAMEESKRIEGELMTLDWIEGHENRLGLVRRFPVGPMLGISPFNFPLNLVAHKVAPVIAVGAPLIIKPATQTPLSSLKLGEVVLEAGWPPEAFSVLPCSGPVAEGILHDERIKKLTFTGSPEVGWHLKALAPKKRVTLELGGNAGVVAHSDIDIPFVARRCRLGAFAYAGQICISVQRIFIHEPIYEGFMEQFLDEVNQIVVGDPLDEATEVGPLIDLTAAARLEEWVAEALDGGATLLAGGQCQGTVMEPTVLAGVKPQMRVSCLEAFGPVVTVQPYEDFMEAVRAVNDSIYGLQAGIFTNDLRVVHRAYEVLEVGGIIVNDVPTYRVDHMPYGGVKESGFGREGLKYAIEEMTEMRLMVLNLSS